MSVCLPESREEKTRITTLDRQHLWWGHEGSVWKEACFLIYYPLLRF